MFTQIKEQQPESHVACNRANTVTDLPVFFGNNETRLTAAKGQPSLMGRNLYTSLSITESFNV